MIEKASMPNGSVVFLALRKMKPVIFRFAIYVSLISSFTELGMHGVIKAYSKDLSHGSQDCSSTLNAMFSGDANQIVSSELQGHPVTQEEKDTFVQSAQLGLDRMKAAGSGLPVTSTIVPNVVLAHGDDATVDKWTFPNGIIGFAGCVRYADIQNNPTSIVRLNTNLEALKSELDAYSHGHLIANH